MSQGVSKQDVCLDEWKLARTAIDWYHSRSLNFGSLVSRDYLQPGLQLIRHLLLSAPPGGEQSIMPLVFCLE